MKRHRHILLLGLFAAVSLVPARGREGATDLVRGGQPRDLGVASGSNGVNPFGASTYSYPVVVPEGRLGMGPKLSLEYNSNLENGLLGVGWYLEGPFSAIVRIPWDAGINYDNDVNNDVFALTSRYGVPPSRSDRLVPMDANRTHYREARDSMMRFEPVYPATRIPNHSDSPSHWVVKRGDGTTLRYGEHGLWENGQAPPSWDYRQAAPQGRVVWRPTSCVAQCAPGGWIGIYAWLLTRVEDMDGNYYSIKWGTSDHGAWPVEITYTQNRTWDPSRTDQHKISFSYDVRNDPVPFYGYSQRMRAIQVESFFRGAWKTVRKYELSYGVTTQHDYYGPISGRSRLRSVRVGAPDPAVPSKCSWLPDTVFHYTEGASATVGSAGMMPFEAAIASGGANLVTPSAFYVFNPHGTQDQPSQEAHGLNSLTADINGDGMQDLVRIELDFSNRTPRDYSTLRLHVETQLGSTAGVGTSQSVLDTKLAGTFGYVHPIDRQPDYLDPENKWTLPFIYNSFLADAGDVNGDGVADIVLALRDQNRLIVRVLEGTSAGLSGTPKDFLDINDRASLGLPARHPAAYCRTRLALADVNGDQKDDLLIMGAKLWYAISDGTNFRLPQAVPDAFVYVQGTTAPKLYDEVLWNGTIRTRLSGVSFTESGDLDRDGTIDLPGGVYGTVDAPPPFLPDIYAWDRAFLYTSQRPYMSLEVKAVLTPDLNGDGRRDVVVAADNNSNLLYVIVSYGTPTGLSRPKAFAYDAPRSFSNPNTPDSSVVAGDINGDGFVDISFVDQFKPYVFTFFSVPGGGFVGQRLADGSFVIGTPPGGAPLGYGNQRKRALAMDINGDGYSDIVQSGIGPDGFELSYAFGSATGSLTTFGYANTDARGNYPFWEAAPGDLDGDGKHELVHVFYGTANRGDHCRVTLVRWDRLGNLSLFGTLYSDPATAVFGYVRVLPADFNGDGKEDLLMCPEQKHESHNNPQPVRYLKNPTGTEGSFARSSPDLLVKVQNGFGGTIDIEYRHSAESITSISPQARGGGGWPQILQPIVAGSTQGGGEEGGAGTTALGNATLNVGVPDARPRPVVRLVSTHNGRYLTTSVRYGYHNGRVRMGHMENRANLGFEIVEQFDMQAWGTTVTRYQQDLPFGPYVARVQKWAPPEAGGPFMLVQESRSRHHSTGSSVPLAVLPLRTVEEEYESLNLVSEKTTEWEFDNFQNVKLLSVKSGGQRNVTLNEYLADSSSRWLVRRLDRSTTQVIDSPDPTAVGKVLEAVKHTYHDSAGFPLRLWKTERYLFPRLDTAKGSVNLPIPDPKTLDTISQGNVVPATSGDWKIVQRIEAADYDRFGLVHREYDAEGLWMDRNYETHWNTHKSDETPSSTRRPSGSTPLTTGYEYDFGGRLLKTTDPNGNVTRTEYDEHGRPVKTFLPPETRITPESSQVPATEITYFFSGDPKTQNIATLQRKDRSTSFVTAEYFDGFGQVYAKMEFSDVCPAWQRSGASSQDSNTRTTDQTWGTTDTTDSTDFTSVLLQSSGNPNGPQATSLVRFPVPISFTTTVQQTLTATALGTGLGIPPIVTYREAFHSQGRGRKRLIVRYSRPEYASSNAWHWIEIQHDALGRPIKVRQVLTTARLADGSVDSTAAGTEERVLETYDYRPTGGGREIAIHDAYQIAHGKAVVPKTQYDVRGRVVKKIDARQKELRYAYDANDQVKTVILPTGDTETRTYDGWGRVIEHEQVSTQRPAMNKTKFEYDLLGNITKKTLDGGGCTYFVFDWLHRIKAQRITNESGHFEDTVYVYDQSGRLGRLCEVAQNAAIAPNGAPMLDTITISQNPVWRTTYDMYDERGNLLSQREWRAGLTGPFPSSYTYDWGHRVVTQTYPDGDTVQYLYHNDGTMRKIFLRSSLPQVTVTNNSLTGGTATLAPVTQQIIAHYQDIDARRRAHKVTYGNGVETTYTYDVFEYLDTLITMKGSVELQNLDYTFDEVGNVSRIDDRRAVKGKPRYAVDTDATQWFEYDEEYRLTDAHGTLCGWTRYVYDDMGFMTSMYPVVSGPAPQTHTVFQYAAANGKNRRVTGTSPGGATLWDCVYDANGNRTSFQMVWGAGPQWTYRYDSENRLKEATSTTMTLQPGGTLITPGKP